MDLKELTLFFWIDELEFTFLDWDLFNNVFFDFTSSIDDDNSSFAYLYLSDFDIKFHYSKIYPKWYDWWLKFSTIVDDQIIDCFALIKGRDWKIMSSKDKVVFYSSFFILQQLWKLSFSLFDFMSCFGDCKLHRLDVALDLPLDIKQINQSIFSSVNFFAQIWRDKKYDTFSQTYYINNPRSDRNRKYIFRIYDKILDSVKKQKSFLYPHLVNNSDVRRIELELRAEECSRILNYSVYDILQNKNNCVYDIFSFYFNKHSNIKLNKYPQIYLENYYNENIDLKSIYLSTSQIPDDYMSRANWYIKNIINNTSYNWLFDTIIKNLSENNNKLNDLLNLFDWFLDYVKNSNLSKSLIKKILKKYDF